jgi:hypothetical protein
MRWLVHLQQSFNDIGASTIGKDALLNQNSNKDQTGLIRSRRDIVVSRE